jgi:hypothetical protein
LGFPNWAGDPTRQVKHLFKTAGSGERLYLMKVESAVCN